jgi:sec-independent protein translocase protein TatB
MFNIGFGELAIICIVLIIAVGPERLPSMMKTVGKTMRTLRQASRDLRESTGIDELLREDFTYVPPPRPAPPPEGPPQISRDATPVVDPTSTPLAPLSAPSSDLPDPAADVAAAPSLPSDGPVTDGEPVEPVPPAAAPAELAHSESSLPSDAPFAAPPPEPAKPRES